MTLYEGTNMFERFTDRARHVVVLAQDEARSLNHHYIGSEHLLLGILNENENLAAKALKQQNVTPEVVRAELEKLIGQGTEAVPKRVHIPFTPRLKKILELGYREALRFEHHYIGTEHLLLALEREGTGVAIQVLNELGIDLKVLRQDVIAGMMEDGFVTRATVMRSRQEIERDIESHEGALEQLRVELKRLDDIES